MNTLQRENLNKEQLLQRIICFLEAMSRECKGCYIKTHCNNCNNQFAKQLLDEINKDTSVIVEGEGSRVFKKKQRMLELEKYIGNEWKSVKDIDLPNVTLSAKQKALRKALAEGLLERRAIGKNEYQYKIRSK